MERPDSRGGDGPIIEADSVSRRFKTIEAVGDVSFDVRPGELFGFLGPNGAGKTTTINMLTTLLAPTSGTARVGGYDVTRQRSAVRRSIGLVFQQPTLDEYLSAEQNLRFHAYAYGVDRGLRERRMTELLEMVELADRRSGSVRTFSGGMKRRLEIARGLLHRPSVLFLDEPTLGLDPQTRRRIWDYLHVLREQEGLTIFLTTHYMDEAEHCDRIAVIDHGRITALDTPDGLKRRFGGDLVILRAADNAAAAAQVRDDYGLPATVQEGRVSFHVPNGEEFLPGFVRRFDQPLTSITVRRPTLDDVFVDLTGHEIRDSELDEHDLLIQAGRR